MSNKIITRDLSVLILSSYIASLMCLLLQINRIHLSRLVQYPVNVVFTNHFVEMHRELVVVHAIPHDVVAVL